MTGRSRAGRSHLGANTAVLIAYGVRELTWMAEPRSTARTVWNVLGSTPSTQDGVFWLGLLIWPRARLR